MLPSDIIRRIAREPLAQFVAVGAAIFAAYTIVNRAPLPRPEQVVVSAGRVDSLAATFAQLQQRPPTTAELKGLIDDFVREEIMSREAVKLGLDQGDAVIRRRLQQKLEFVTSDLASLEEPTEPEMASWLESHADRYRREVRFTFRHVYLNPDRHGPRLDSEAQGLLERLKNSGPGADIDALGDTFLLPHSFQDAAQSAVASTFGSAFAGALAAAPQGEWAGPFRSGFGVHVVCVTTRTEARTPTLAEAHEVVKRDLLNARRVDANQKLLEGLLAKYTVTVESPGPSTIAPIQDPAKP